jgi:integrase
MGTVSARKRSDGSTGYTAQIRLKRAGAIVHTESRTFDRKQAAKAWMERRESELQQPGALTKREDPTLAESIDRYLGESKRSIGKTKAQVLRSIKADRLASIPGSQITSADILDFLQRLNAQPQTRLNYASHLAAVFAIAKPAWGHTLDQQAMRDAMIVARRLGVTGKSKRRELIPTIEQLNALMDHFAQVRSRRRDSIPMQAITAFAAYSSRRLSEILRIRWEDLDGDRVMVRSMKNPGDDGGIDTWCDLPPEAAAIIAMQPRTDERIFPFNEDAVGAAFTRACKLHRFDGISFHSLRHLAATRLFEMGGTIPKVAAVTGHRSWSSLQRYAHVRQSGDRLAGWLPESFYQDQGSG